MIYAQSEDINRKIGTYLRRPFFRIQGYCGLLDAKLLRSTIVYQAQEGISGSLVEIGVWHGKSFFILGNGRMPGEKSLAIDLFPTRSLVKKERQQIDEFRDNCAAASINLGANEILQSDSLQLCLEDILRRVGRARLIHLDGAHDYKHALHDLNLAQAALLDDGVLVLDDVFNPHWPEVCAAMFDWIRENPEFEPWAGTGFKLYLARSQYKGFYETIIRQHFRREMGRFAEMFGGRFIMLDPPMVDQIRERLKVMLLTPRQVSMPRAV